MFAGSDAGSDYRHFSESSLRLRDAVGPIVGCLLDPSQLFWQGMELLRWCGSSDTFTTCMPSRGSPCNARANGALDPEDFFQLTQNRSWNFRTVGYAHSGRFWRTIISTSPLTGYDDVLSIETDPLFEPGESLRAFSRISEQDFTRKPPVPLWFRASGRMTNSEKG
jgi:hypothetical protein